MLKRVKYNYDGVINIAYKHEILREDFVRVRFVIVAQKVSL